nr:hypothetical protein [Vibrio diabolicus]
MAWLPNKAAPGMFLMLSTEVTVIMMIEKTLNLTADLTILLIRYL